MPELADLQRRFHAIATGVAPLDDALELLTGDHRRMAIYRRMYRDRLVDAIADDYPKLVALLGTAWPALATAYVRAYPPANPDIHHAGARLPEYLASHGEIWQRDLARLEWARADVFFARDATPLDRERLAILDADAFPSLALHAVPAFQLVALDSNADDLWSAVEDELPPPAPCEARRWVAVWRRGCTAVIHRALDVDEAPCVQLLARGTTFSAICDALVQVPDAPTRAIELLLRWLDAELLDATMIQRRA